MIRDVYLEALREYEREVAPAYEVIRRARARLRDRVVDPLVDSIDTIEDPFWAGIADPTEPNGAEFAVEGAVDQPPADPGQSGVSSEAPVSGPDDPPAVSTEETVAVRCECGYQAASPHGLRIHRARSHKKATTSKHPSVPARERRDAKAAASISARDRMRTTEQPAQGVPAEAPAEPETDGTPAPASTAVGDPREIDEACGRGCGRRFRWSPALVNHERSCDGVAK